MKQITRFLPVALALMLVFTGIDKKGSFDITEGVAAQRPAIARTELPQIARTEMPSVAPTEEYQPDASGSKQPEVPVVPGLVADEDPVLNMKKGSKVTLVG